MSTRINNESAVSITPLLKRLWPVDESVTAEEIANAISHIFTDSLSPVQTGALLTGLHFTGLDRRSDVLSHCAQAMRDASAQVDKQALRDIIRNRGRREGTYAGGLVGGTLSSIYSLLLPYLLVRCCRHRRRFAQYIQCKHDSIHCGIIAFARRQAWKSSINFKIRIGRSPSKHHASSSSPRKNNATNAATGL